MSDTPRTDAETEIEFTGDTPMVPAELAKDLERQCARQTALLRECQDRLAGKRNEELFERIELELGGKND